MTDKIGQPVTEPTTPQEMVQYVAFHLYRDGARYFDSDEYLDVEVDYAQEQGFDFDDYDDDDAKSRWNQHISTILRDAHFLAMDQHLEAARALLSPVVPT